MFTYIIYRMYKKGRSKGLLGEVQNNDVITFTLTVISDLIVLSVLTCTILSIFT